MKKEGRKGRNEHVRSEHSGGLSELVIKLLCSLIMLLLSKMLISSLSHSPQRESDNKTNPINMEPNVNPARADGSRTIIFEAETCPSGSRVRGGGLTGMERLVSMGHGDY